MTGTPIEHAGYWGHLRAQHVHGAFSLFLRAFLPFVGVLLIAGAAAFSWRMTMLDRDLDRTIVAFLELASARLQKDLQAPIEDLHFLAAELERAENPMSDVAGQLRNLSLARKRYAHLRLLNDSGLELARIDRDKSVASQRDLGDWSRSNLFATLAPLQDGELYVSSFELRTERGKIVEPFEPIIRFVKRTAGGNGRRTGYIVIELDARETLDALKIANPNGFVELLTSDGYWVRARDPKLEWGAVLREREHLLFSTRHARAWGVMTASVTGDAGGVARESRVESGKTRTEGGGFWYRMVRSPEASVVAPSWMLVLHVPQDRLRARELGAAAGLAALMLAAALIAAPFYWWLARRAQLPR
jgi:hypothetical protein